jgi:hypothetical protein
MTATIGMSNHDRFLQYMGGQSELGNSCYDGPGAGAPYLCPAPTMGGELRASDEFGRAYSETPVRKQDGVPSANLGRLAYCGQGSQAGGSGRNFPDSLYDGHSLVYTAGGQMKTRKDLCARQQRGGDGGLTPAMVPAGAVDTSLDWANRYRTDWPYQVRFNPGRQYGNLYIESPAWYFDNTQPAIARRPVVNRTTSWRQVPSTVDACKVAQAPKFLRRRRFNCRQPFWQPECI